MTIPDPKASFGETVLFRWHNSERKSLGVVCSLEYQCNGGTWFWTYSVRIPEHVNSRHIGDRDIIQVLKKADA